MQQDSIVARGGAFFSLKKKGRGSKRRAWWHAPLISAFVLQRLVDLSGLQGEFQGFTVRTYPTPMLIAGKKKKKRAALLLLTTFYLKY